MFATTSPAIRKDIYAAILPPSLGILYTTGQQLNTLIKQSLHSLVSLAFSSFAELQDRVPEFEEWVRSKGGRKDNELGELLHAFRGSCLRSLPEFIEDTKVNRSLVQTRAHLTQAWGSKAPTSADLTVVGVHVMTVNVRPASRARDG